ncbi:hypothetical protein MesoLjLa_09110 [Mesorhizobium sp. L-2-11]|nr:hypothetical protein MesoLjLa_09110 [Mesorhizobium sp. L-2-11]
MPDLVPEDSLPNVDKDQFRPIDLRALLDVPRSIQKPRVLMLYGSLRERSYSRLATEEAARILRRLGAEVRIYNPACRCRIRPRPIMPKSRNCEICRSGRKRRSGARRSGMAR